MNLRERAHFAWLDHVETAESGLDVRGAAALQRALDDQALEPETVKLEPFATPPVAFYKIEQLDFRVLFKDDAEPLVFVQRRQAWCPVSSVTDLGKVFKDDPLPDEDPAAAVEPRAAAEGLGVE